MLFVEVLSHLQFPPPVITTQMTPTSAVLEGVFHRQTHLCFYDNIMAIKCRVLEIYFAYLFTFHKILLSFFYMSRVTICPYLLSTNLIYVYCPYIIIDSDLFHSQKCPDLNNWENPCLFANKMAQNGLNQQKVWPVSYLVGHRLLYSTPV